MIMKKTRNIGVEVPAPTAVSANDKKDPFAGMLKVRGREFVGTVVSDKPMRTVIVEWARRKKNPKYERYEKRKTRLAAHNPESINAKLGDKVRIIETRPISKTKHFVVIENLGVDEAKLVKESEMESKPQKPKKEADEK
jgi:small subunit ribosomal protein S17